MNFFIIGNLTNNMHKLTKVKYSLLFSAIQFQFYERILHVSLGPALYGLSAIGAMGSLSLGFVQALVFASFIVAVDPVAVSYHTSQ